MTELPLSATVLANGLRVVLIDLPYFHTVTNLLAIRSGSRYELPSNNGIAHFLEHLVFKGTAKYPNHQSVASAIEGVGGILNAWTGVDQTVYWNTVPEAAWQVGLEMPFELAFRPKLNAADMERERGVIKEEIRGVQDDPSSHVSEIAHQLIYAGHSLGQLVIGTEENIDRFAIEDFQSYHRQFYHSRQSLLIAVGNLSGKDYASRIKELSADLVDGQTSQFTPFLSPAERQIRVVDKRTDQAHFILGLASPAFQFAHAPTRAAMSVLNSILGRGMSSRLFTEVREKRGLAYTIGSSYSAIEDAGDFVVYGGVNTVKLDRSLTAIKEQIERLQNEPVGSTELEQNQQYLCGQLDLQADQPLSLARRYGARALLGMDESLEKTKALIKAVTAAEIQAAAQQHLQAKLFNLAVIGQSIDEDKLSAIFS